ncbi:unnamed protein product, partial [Rotaria sp. Silwood1]
MVSVLTFFVLLSIGFVQGALTTNKSCKVQIDDSSNPCGGSVWVPRPCDSATLKIPATHFTSCTAVSIRWAYPMNNFTIIIEAPFTQQLQSYSIAIDNALIKESDIRVYRILDGREIEVKSTGDVIVQN